MEERAEEERQSMKLEHIGRAGETQATAAIEAL